MELTSSSKPTMELHVLSPSACPSLIPALHAAAHKGLQKVLQVLIEAGAEVNAVISPTHYPSSSPSHSQITKSGKSAYALAAEGKHIRAQETLLLAGAKE